MGFETNREQQKDNADLGERAGDVGRLNQIEKSGTYDDSRDDLADYRRLPDPLAKLGHQLCGDKNNEEGQEDLRMTASSQQKQRRLVEYCHHCLSPRSIYKENISRRSPVCN